MNKVRCAHCGCWFVPNPRIKNQRFCSSTQCQHARKASWQRQKLATDPDYQADKKDGQRDWQIRNPGYWQKWRLGHPEYVERNRMLQQKRRQRGVAKMDALEPLLGIKTGSYYIIPEHEGIVAKMDASAQKVRLILTG